MRELHQLEEAEALGRQAHSRTPGDYRPCTLMGAVLRQRGDLAGGYDWYANAEQLGASRKAIDQDLRSLLVRLPSQERQRICDCLIAQDPERLAWLLRRHDASRSEENTSELQSLMRNSYAVFCLNKKHILLKPPTY